MTKQIIDWRGFRQRAKKVSRRKSTRIRRLSQFFECLERRDLLAVAIWNNPVLPVDVSGDSPASVSPIDVLLVINAIRSGRYNDPATDRLVRETAEPILNRNVDVSCDGVVAPNDVLLVINYLRRFGSDSVGGMPTDGGTHANASCSPLLVEQTRFVNELTRLLKVPNDRKALEIRFETPSFDGASLNQIRDAFEIEIRDDNGNPIVLPIRSSQDVVFNWSEGLAPVMASGVTNGSNTSGGFLTATVDLSSVATDTLIQVATRLVNNDQDNGSQVVIRGYEFVNAMPSTPSSVTGEGNALRSAARFNPQELSDVSGSVLASYGRTSLSADNTELITELTLTNVGNQAVRGPLFVVFDNFSALEVSAMQPDGILPDGRPYLDVTSQLNGTALAPDQSILSREVRFLNNSNQRFTYQFRVFGKLNSAPSEFTSVPLDSIQVDRTYRYKARAADRDTDTLVYTVVTGPDAMVIHPLTGEVTWIPNTAAIGSHIVTLRATDPFGLFVEQTFTINVLEDQQNRPPNFVTDPFTEAIASSGFEVSTIRVGENPVGVTVANIGLDDGTLVTINRGTQSLSQITALGNDRYGLPTELTVGEPGPVDQILRSGFNIDVGLPPFIRSNDGNSIRGLDQADLNGDGLLDIVISAHVFTSVPTNAYTQMINVAFGAGDGKFSEPVNLASIPTTNSSNPRTLRVADFDQNGTLDILALNLRISSADPSPALLLIRGAGDGSFSPVEIMPIATILNDFKTVDLNQDGVLDLIGATSDTRSLGYMLGNGDGTFTSFTSVVTVTNNLFNSSFPGRNYAASDIDADGDIDIVYSHFSTGNINVLANDGNLNFTLAASFVSRQPFGNNGPASIYSVFVGDFNGDALIDIAYGAIGYTSNVTGSLGVFIRDSSGFTFTYRDGADGIAYRPGNWAGNSEPIDIDGDGDLDLLLAGVTTSEFGSGSSVLRNRGDGTFTSNNISLPYTDKSPYEISGSAEGDTKGILTGDYNGDGMQRFPASTKSQGIR